MSPELTEHLIKTYTILYNKNAYFACDDGWYDLINQLSFMIESRAKSIDGEVLFDYCKEKYAGLRYSVFNGDDHIWGLISMAESMSYIICEICGDLGIRMSTGKEARGLHKTLCYFCAEHDSDVCNMGFIPASQQSKKEG